jgi:hypothetical protein
MRATRLFTYLFIFNNSETDAGLQITPRFHRFTRSNYADRTTHGLLTVAEDKFKESNGVAENKGFQRHSRIKSKRLK